MIRGKKPLEGGNRWVFSALQNVEIDGGKLICI